MVATFVRGRGFFGQHIAFDGKHQSARLCVHGQRHIFGELTYTVGVVLHFDVRLLAWHDRLLRPSGHRASAASLRVADYQWFGTGVGEHKLIFAISTLFDGAIVVGFFFELGNGSGHLGRTHSGDEESREQKGSKSFHVFLLCGLAAAKFVILFDVETCSQKWFNKHWAKG